VKKTFGRRAGMLSYLGTTDFRVICAKVVEGDPKYVEAYQALVYQLSKDIGAMAAVLHFDVDAIVFTGGMAYEQFFCDDITAYVGKLAQTIRLPGEEEMRSLAEGALRVLHGEQEASIY
jgi:butyrate kinase